MRGLLAIVLLSSGCGGWQGLQVFSESSSSVDLIWNRAKNVHHYEWLVTDELTQQQFTESSAAFVQERTLTGLKAATLYTIELTACRDEACERTIGTLSLQVTTEPERWQVLGDGTSFDTAWRAVDDSTAPNPSKGVALVYGEQGPDGYEGYMTLWYDPGADSTWGAGVQPAPSDGVVGTDLQKLVGLQPLEWHGLKTPTAAPWADLFREIRSMQAVPVAGDNVTRLYFTGSNTSHEGALLYVDSQDVFLGHDFAESLETFCERGGHYNNEGSACEVFELMSPQDVGQEPVAGVAAFGKSRIVWEQRSDWRWSQDPQSASLLYEATMVDAGCSTYDYNIGKATWTGSRFDTGAACPEHWGGMREPTPVHQGGRQFKLYYYEDAATGGAGPTAGAPLKHLYARADFSGTPTRLDDGDWEDPSIARDVVLEWSDGTTLTADEAGGLTDLQVLWPTNDEQHQVMLATMPSSTGTFVGWLQLVNP